MNSINETPQGDTLNVKDALHDLRNAPYGLNAVKRREKERAAKRFTDKDGRPRGYKQIMSNLTVM